MICIKMMKEVNFSTEVKVKVHMRLKITIKK